MTGESGSSGIKARWNKPLTEILTLPAGFADLCLGGTPDGMKLRTFRNGAGPYHRQQG